MQNPRSRRRFLTDMLFAGGALLGACVVGRNQPFFEPMLEGQAQGQARLADSHPGHGITHVYPADTDRDQPTISTGPYPADSDPVLMTTCAHPSDSDHDLPRNLPVRRPDATSSLPFWSAVQG